jgi:hypothetical protein
MCEAEPATDNPAVAEQFLDLVRMRRCADIEVLRPAAQEQIPDAAADEVRYIVVFVESVKDLESGRIDVSTGYRMRGPRKDGRFHHHLGL